MAKIKDLRSALEYLRTIPGQLVETNVEADPHAEISGIYRYVGAGGTVMRPTQEGPAMVFNNVKGHPDARVAIGVLASRKRVGYLLDEKPENLGFKLMDAVTKPIPPVVIPNEGVPCQELVYRATEPDFDVRRLVPAPTNTEEDAGPYITMGLCYATDPETGDKDVTIHRLCIQGKDIISMYFVPGGRHLDIFREEYAKLGKPMPISVSIGVDPAICIASCFESPTTPLGYDELSCAGALRGEPVELTKKEYQLLEYLLRNKRTVLSRDQILSTVWGYDYIGDTNVVDVYIRYLRAKIDERFGEKYIHTMRGVGYVIKD